MAYTEILTGNGLTEEVWNRDIFKTWLGHTWWKNLMGPSSDDVIQVKDDLTKKAGDSITLGIRDEMSGGLVTGNATGIGNEGSVNFFNQRITIDNVRRLIKVKDVDMSNKRVGFDVLMEAREALQQKFRFDLEDAITTALSDIFWLRRCSSRKFKTA